MLKKSNHLGQHQESHNQQGQKMVSNIFKVTTKWTMISTSTPYETYDWDRISNENLPYKCPDQNL